MIRQVFRRIRGQRAQAMVEFALLTPLLLMLMLGAVDGGRALYAVVSVNNAAFHSALWTSNHLKYGTQGTPSCGSSTATCCPTSNNTSAFNADATPASIREVVLRDFLAGLNYHSSCPASSQSLDNCNPLISCDTQLEDGLHGAPSYPSYSYSGTPYRYVDVTVTYRWTAVGPYGPIVGNLDIPKTLRIRDVP